MKTRYFIVDFVANYENNIIEPLSGSIGYVLPYGMVIPSIESINDECKNALGNRSIQKRITVTNTMFVDRDDYMSYLGIKELPTEPKSSEPTDLELIKKLVDALKGTVDGYCNLIDSGDCGNWDPRQDEFIIHANRAIIQAK